MEGEKDRYPLREKEKEGKVEREKERENKSNYLLKSDSHIYIQAHITHIVNRDATTRNT